MVWIAPEGDRDHTHYRERQQHISCRQQSESDHCHWHDVLECGERFLQLRLEHLNARVNEIQQFVSDFRGNAGEAAPEIGGASGIISIWPSVLSAAFQRTTPHR